MERIDKEKIQKNGNGRTIFASILIGASITMILNIVGLLPDNFSEIILNWKFLLIAIGTLNILFNHSKISGYILITIGLFFWLPDFFCMPKWIDDLFWPVLMLIIGLFLLSSKIFKCKRPSLCNKTFSENEMTFDIVNIFGGNNATVTSKSFTSGKITSIFGGGEVDFTNAEISGDSAEIEITCVFGGVTLILPAHWEVQNNLSAILGGVEDKRTIIHTGGKVLYIKGAVVFGGAEIKSI